MAADIAGQRNIPLWKLTGAGFGLHPLVVNVHIAMATADVSNINKCYDLCLSIMHWCYRLFTGVMD